MYGLEGKGSISKKNKVLKSAYIEQPSLSCEPLCSGYFGILAWTGSGHYGEFNIEDVLSSL